ncbi:MAG: glycosyltransferase [Bacteroidia bacterium]
MKVAALTSGKNVPSARFRVRQYLDYLKLEQIVVEELYSSIDKYSPPTPIMQQLAFGDWKRATRYMLWLKQQKKKTLVKKANTYDVIWLERNLVETRLTYELQLKHPLVLDLDDAIWLNEARGFEDKLASHADVVFAGNAFLADRMSKYNSNVTVIPTAVDTSAFIPAVKKEQQKVNIGWIGTSSNFQYLKALSAVLERISRENKDIEVHICSDKKPDFFRFPFHFEQWSSAVEIPFIQKLDIGLMPLEDNEWTRGKCSFKMLQYMSCGVPALVSPYGMNAEVLALWDQEMGAVDEHDWYAKLHELAANPDRRTIRGQSARAVVLQHYAVDVVGKKIAEQFKKLI